MNQTIKSRAIWLWHDVACGAAERRSPLTANLRRSLAILWQHRIGTYTGTFRTGPRPAKPGFPEKRPAATLVFDWPGRKGPVRTDCVAVHTCVPRKGYLPIPQD